MPGTVGSRIISDQFTCTFSEE